MFRIIKYYFLLSLFVTANLLSIGQATLPHSRTAWGSEPTGWTNSGCSQRTTTFACSGSDATTFDTNGDSRTLFIASSPGNLVFKLKGSSMSGESFLTVEESPDNSAWSTLGTYGTGTGATAISACADITLSLLSNTRYIRWTYTKASGNCDMDDVSVSNPTCIDENFDSYTGGSAPAGFTFNSISYYASGYTAANSLKFDATNDYIVTENIASSAATLSFWIQGNATDATSAALVEGWNGSSWTTIENINPIPTSWTNKSYSSISSYYKFRITYTKSAGNLQLDDFSLTCTGCTEPTTQPNTPVFSSVTETGMTLSWTGGDGDGTYVIARADNAVNVSPTSGINHTVSSIFGSGQDISAGDLNYGIYRWTGGSVNITGLSTETTYHYALFEYNTTDNCYLRSTPLTCSQPTICNAPTTDASALSISNIATTSFDLSWTNGNGTYRIVVVKPGSAVDFTPTNTTTYTADTDYSTGTDLGSGNKVVYNGTGASVSVSGLTAGTHYYVTVYEYHCGTGYESYYTGGAPPTADDVTTPFNCTNLTTVCKTTTDISLQWSLPGGNYDGILVFCRDGATPSGPGVTDASSYTGANSDFTLATDYAAKGKLMYSGAGVTSLTISNLTPGNTYQIKIYTYKDATGTTWSSGTGTTQVAELTETSNFISTTGNVSLGLSWRNPDGSCFDEVLIIAKSGSAVTTAPTGDGSAYTANAAFGSGTDMGGSEFVVYQGTGTYVNVTGLTNGTTYYFEIFVRKGSTWSNGVTCTGTPADISVFRPGDVVFVGFDTHTGASGPDKLIFTNFIEIQPNTEIIFCNAVWEYKAAANERTYKWYSGNGYFGVDVPYFTIKYTGASNLAVGSIMCMEITIGGSFGSMLVNGAASADWVDNGDAGTNVQFSSSAPDAIWMMQGTLTTGLTDDDGDKYGVLNGRVLGGIQTRGTFQDFSVAGNNGGSRVSRIHPDIECMGISTGGSSSAYYGEYSAAADHNNTQTALLSAITNTGANWNLTSGGDNVDNLTVCSDVFTVTTGFTPGLWQGTTDEDWFKCANWDDFQVPNASTNVTIKQDATNNCTIGGAGEAEALSISITSNTATNNILKIEAASSLTVGEDITLNKTMGGGSLSVSVTGASTLTCENLTIQGSSAGANDGLFINEEAANTITINGNITIGTGGKIDLDGAADEGIITLKGNWTNNETAGTGFDEGSSTIIFSGGSAQTIDTDGFEEQFANVTVNKALGGDITISDNVEVKNILTLTDGVITTGSNILEVSSTTSTDITGYSNISFINGNLRRHIAVNTDTYPLPVGYGGTATTNYFRADFINNSIDAGITYFNVSVTNITESGNNIDSRLGANAYQDGSKILNIFEDAQWTISPDAYAYTSGDYGVNLYIENVSGPVDNQYTVLKRPDGSTDYADWSTFEATTTIPAKDAAGRIVSSGYAQRLGFTTFSGFGGGGSQYPLPIQLLDFTGKLIDSDAHLSWTTASEINNDHFEIEKSNDNKNFYSIGTEMGAGNSNRLLNYSFIDYKIDANTPNYYRLKQVDFDGKFSYSKSIQLNYKSIDSDELNVTLVTPNRVKVTSTIGRNQLDIYNAIGQNVSTETIYNGTTYVDIDNKLPNGVYFIKVSNAKEVKTLKVNLQ